MRDGGERSEGPMLDGLRHGTWTTYNFYGEAVARTNFEFGYLHGDYRKLNGVITKVKGEFNYGEPVGEWQYFNNRGRKTFAEAHLKTVAFDASLIESEDDPLTWRKQSNWYFDPLQEGVRFIDGDKAEEDYLADNLVMPQEAASNSVEGEVQLQLTIDEMGEVINTRVMRGIGYGCDEEAVRLMEGMPWRLPMVEGGIPQKTRINVVVPFLGEVE